MDKDVPDTAMGLDVVIIFLETERLRLKNDWRELLLRTTLSEEEKTVKSEIEEDMARFEQALNVLREAVSQDKEGAGCSQKQRK